MKLQRRGAPSWALAVVGSIITTAPVSADGNIARHWYMRADIGIGRSTLGTVSQSELAANGGSFISESIGDTVIAGAGIGIQAAKNVRIDLTGEYRSRAALKALDNLSADIVDPNGTLQANTLYQGNVSAYVGLLNAYLDLPTWRGITPYIGGGVGVARVQLRDLTTSTSATFTDAVTGAETVQVTHGLGGANAQHKFAWALMAGAAYALTANAKLDLGYRYLNLGNGSAAASGMINCVCGTVGSPLKFSDLESHEFRIGIRWALETPQSMLRNNGPGGLGNDLALDDITLARIDYDSDFDGKADINDGY